MQKRALTNPIYNFSYNFVSSDIFNAFITLIIIANTVILASDHYKISPTLEKTSDYINYVFLGIFVLELIFKIIGLGIKEYFNDRYNDFDCFIVFFSLIELIISISKLSSTSAGRALQTLRAFRLLRVFKLAKSWTSL